MTHNPVRCWTWKKSHESESPTQLSESRGHKSAGNSQLCFGNFQFSELPTCIITMSVCGKCEITTELAIFILTFGRRSRSSRSFGTGPRFPKGLTKYLWSHQKPTAHISYSCFGYLSAYIRKNGCEINGHKKKERSPMEMNFKKFWMQERVIVKSSKWILYIRKSNFIIKSIRSQNFYLNKKCAKLNTHRISTINVIRR